MNRMANHYIKFIKKQIFSKNRLDFLILFVTSKCNSKCKTCFFYSRLNKKDDLRLEELYKISDNLGNFTTLLLSGGEPFMLQYLTDMCSKFIRDNNAKILSIPTNASLTNKIVKDTETLLRKYPNVTISINPSIDGLKGTHDSIRGVKSSFDKAIETMKVLCILKEKYSNLQILVNTVIHKENLDEIEELSMYLRKFNIDQHVFELMRGDSASKELKRIDLEETKKIHKFIIENSKYYIKNNNYLGKISFLGSLNYMHHLKELSVEGKKWPIECSAGKSIGVIYPEGDVALCELKSVIGNLREVDYDFKKILKTRKAKEEFRKIRNCSCTHVCFINSTMNNNFSSVFKIPYYYFRK
jgi:MoaA/NifB/PqqE/SkfB family radical SAM enzyme